MQQVLKAVNDFFGIFVGFSNFLWSFPTQFSFWRAIPILGQFTMPIILLFSAGITEPTSVLMKSGIKKNGNLRYTIRPIREAIEIFHARQLSAVERAAERQRVQRKLSAMDLLPGA